MSERNVNELIDHLFRHEAGKLVALLVKIFGTAHLELAEDIVQDTLLDALNRWSVSKIPDNPAAWITQVAKRKTINALKRLQSQHIHYAQAHYLSGNNLEAIDEVFLDKEIKDSQLRMIFTCCHPVLAVESQLALTLKTLCGFSVKEIANALLTTESNINKRLYRAKQKIKTTHFEVPAGDALDERMNAVYLSLYLLYNEGYNSTHHETMIRQDICAEAIRLTLLLNDQLETPKGNALLALMYLHAARFDARLDQRGGIIIFKDQDRNLWDRQMIALGLQYLQRSSTGNELSEYHLEAGIAAQHCVSDSYEATNWHNIARQYELLYHIKPNPIIQLNLAIVASQIEGIPTAVERLEGLLSNSKLKNYYLLYASLGMFYQELKQHNKAIAAFEAALERTASQSEIDFLTRNIEACKA